MWIGNNKAEQLGIGNGRERLAREAWAVVAKGRVVGTAHGGGQGPRLNTLHVNILR